MENSMKVLVWVPRIEAAVVQGVTGQYVVFYHRKTCSCPDHQNRHRECKHIRLVLDELSQAAPPQN